MATFGVNFADPKGFYFPGENVIGTITVSLQEEIKFREFSVTFKGKSRCRWSTGSGDNRRTHWNREEYFKTTVVFVTPGPDGEARLGPGSFSYPFDFLLPTNIPPSFEVSSLGTASVVYSLKMKFDVGSWMPRSDIKSTAVLRVVCSPVDLTRTNQLVEPTRGETEKFLCCLCCQSGPIRLRCQLNKQTFYLGEQITFSFELDNRATQKHLRKIEARLEQEVTYISNTSRTRRNSHAVSSFILAGGLDAGGEESWQNVSLLIPTGIMPTFQNCRCVNVTYIFLVEVDIPSAIDSKVAFPVTIVSGFQTSQPGFQPAMAPPVTAFGSEGYQQPSVPHAMPGAAQGTAASAPPIAMQPIPVGFAPTQPPPPYPVEDIKRT